MSLRLPEHNAKSHRTHLTIPTSLGRSQANKRRSNRMGLHAPIGLSGEDRLKVTFTMPAKATNLNRHGAAVQLSRDLVVGTVLVVRNKRGIEVPARVVAQLIATKGISTYAIEFVEQGDSAKDFWGITFPTSA